MNINRKTGIRILSFFGAALLILGGFLLQEHTKNSTLNRAISHAYARNFSDLIDSAEILTDSLQKAVYASSPSYCVKIGTEIYGAAAAAELALSKLPLNSISLEKTGAFFNKVGQYALALSCQASSVRRDSSDTLENLKALSSASKNLTQKLTELQSLAQEQNISFLYGDENRFYSDSFQTLETESEMLPSLFYDGKYTDGQTKKTPSETVSVSREEILRSFSTLTGHQLSEDSITEREIGVKQYLTISDDAVWAEFDASTGALLYYYALGKVSESAPDEDTARKSAEEFLKKAGLSDLEHTSSVSEDGYVTVSFCHNENGTLCYADECKITVSGNGEVIKADLTEYYSNHAKRTLSDVKITEEEIKVVLPKELTVSSYKSVLLKSEGNVEKQCYEFLCTDLEQNEYRIYYNCETGEMEEIRS